MVTHKINIILYRIYDNNIPPGYHVLVDRLWPRGISKEKANLDDHWKDLAPSDSLRKWFNHEPEKWVYFRKKYIEELAQNEPQAITRLGEVTQPTLVLLYGAKDKNHTHALILQEFLERIERSLNDSYHC